MKKINVNDRLPIAENMDDPCNTYYIVWTEKHGYQKAMYLKAVDEEEGTEVVLGWYTNYIQKLTCEVTHWLDEKEQSELTPHQLNVIVRGICNGAAFRNLPHKIEAFGDYNKITFEGALDIWAICAISSDAEAFGLKATYGDREITIK